MILLDGRKIAEYIYQEIKSTMKKSGIRPGLAAILVGEDSSSKLYVDLKGRVATNLGFYFKKIHLKKYATPKVVMSAIKECNADKKIHGFLVQLPLPPQFKKDDILQWLDSKKDIDCIGSQQFLAFASGDRTIQPPTAQAVIELLSSIQMKLSGLCVVVIGDGFFGRQIALRCLNEDATVLLANSKTRNLLRFTKQADVVITAIGKPGFLTGSMIKKGTVVIDVGITKKGKSILGDVDFNSVSKKACALTPVPGGVGPLTVALLMRNTFLVALERKTKL